MPLDPKRVQAVFLEAVNYHDSVEREAILHRECGQDEELRRRVEALLRAHDQFNDFLNQPFVGPRAWPGHSPASDNAVDREAGT
jgi:eukaryotic-like serine/threonine-protein kinase